MVMSDIVASVFLVLALAGAIAYIVRAKRAGVKCVGCPVAGSCADRDRASAECSCSAVEKILADMEGAAR